MKVLRELQYRPGGLLRHFPSDDGRRTAQGRSAAGWSAAGRSATGPSERGAVNAHRIGVPLMHGLWRVRIHGAANVPPSGRVILAGNHTAFLDGPLIVGVSPRPVHFLVKRELFVGPLAPILHGLGQISVDRERPDRAAVQSALAALRAEGVLGVFPEGTRTTGDFESVHNGLAYFALSSGAPVVPVACLGTAVNGRTVGALPPPRATLDLVFGTPVTLAELTEGTEGLGRRQTIAAVSEQLRMRLAAHVRRSRRITGRDG